MNAHVTYLVSHRTQDAIERLREPHLLPSIIPRKGREEVAQELSPLWVQMASNLSPLLKLARDLAAPGSQWRKFQEPTAAALPLSTTTVTQHTVVNICARLHRQDNERARALVKPSDAVLSALGKRKHSGVAWLGGVPPPSLCPGPTQPGCVRDPPSRPLDK